MMLQDEPRKAVTPPSFSVRLRVTQGNFFAFSVEVGADVEVVTKKEADHDEKEDNFRSQLRFKRLKQFQRRQREAHQTSI